MPQVHTRGLKTVVAQSSRLLSSKEAAAILSLHPVTLAKMRMRGDGPSFVRIRRTIRYRSQDLEKWLSLQVAHNTAHLMIVPQARVEKRS